jgi:hypothetical protein
MLELEADKASLGCEGDSSCLAEIADALGADVLIVGRMSKVGTEHVFAVRRIDQARAAVDGAFTDRLQPSGGEEFLAAIGPAVEQLLPDVPMRPGMKRGVSEKVLLRLRPPPLQPWTF